MLFQEIIFLYLLHLQEINTEKTNEITFINQYVNYQIIPVSVTAFLCWESDDIYMLGKLLNQQFIPTNIQNISEEHIYIPKLFNNLYIIDLNCKETMDFVKKANADKYFREPNHWLMLYNYSQKHFDLNITNLDIFIDAKVIVACKTDNKYILNYVYKYSRKSPIIWDKFAVWVSKEGFIDFQRNTLFCRRRNIEKHTLNISLGILNNSSYAHMTDYRLNEYDTISKLNYFLTIFLMEYMNATYNFIIYNVWYNSSTPNHNGSLYGSILNGEIDISGTPLFCRKDRVGRMDFLAMTTPDKYFFMFRQPPLSYVKNIFILPFDRNLWTTNALFLLLSSFLLYIIVIWEWKMLREKQLPAEVDMIHSTVTDSVLFTMGAVCQQGYATEPKGTPGKILILTIFITLIFLFTAYTAYTVVLFQATSNDIKSLTDLYESSMVLGMEDQPYYKEILSTYPEPLRRQIYDEKINPKGQTGHFYSITKGMEKMKNEYFAFFFDVASGYKVIHDTFLEQEKCGLQEITYIYESDPWIIAPKNAPFKKIYKVGYRKLAEYGLVRREISRRLSHKPKCSTQGTNYRSAGIQDLFSLYVLLIAGVIVSVITLICETLIFRYVNCFKFK